jgi:hypothetical protein
MLDEHHTQQVRLSHKFPSHYSMRGFAVSFDKNALRGKAFEDESR